MLNLWKIFPSSVNILFELSSYEGLAANCLRFGCCSTSWRMDPHWTDLRTAAPGIAFRITVSKKCNPRTSISAAGAYNQVPALRLSTSGKVDAFGCVSSVGIKLGLTFVFILRLCSSSSSSLLSPKGCSNRLKPNKWRPFGSPCPTYCGPSERTKKCLLCCPERSHTSRTATRTSRTRLRKNFTSSNSSNWTICRYSSSDSYTM